MESSLQLNPVLKHLPVYHPGRPIEEVARELGIPANSIIKLASNENPLGPSPLALAAMRKAIKQVNLYPDGSAFYLRQALAAKLNIAPAQLIFGNGSNEILELLGHALLAQDSVSPNATSGRNQPEVIVSQYCFAVYPIVAALFGAKLIEVAAKNYGHDLESMSRAITPQTRLVFIGNPNNPTGTSALPGEIMEFVNTAPEHVVVAVDEAYIEFLENPPDLLAEIRKGTRRNLLLMRTFSKIYGLAGLRVGYGIGHPEFIAGLEKIRQPFNLNAIAQAGALAAMEDSHHEERTRRITRSGLKFFARAFKKLKLEFIPSTANFITVRVGEGQKVFNEMQKLGVIVRPMAGYQLPEWIRISMGTAKENRRCLAALERALRA